MLRIKKYSNRRLYDTRASAYINLEQLAQMIRDGEQVEVVDASTGEDLTRPVLLQVILETGGMLELFPTGLLHRLVRGAVDTPLQRMAMKQAAAGLEMLDAQLSQLDKQFGWMGQAPRAAKAPEPPPAAKAEAPEEAPPSSGPAPASDADDDLAALRARLAALEGRLKR